MIITNFKLKDYLKQSPELIEQYLIALRYIKPIKTKRELFHLKLRHVELVKNNIDSGSDNDLIEIISTVQKCTKEEVLEIPIIEFFGILNAIRKQLKIIVTAEENALTPSEVNMKWEIVEGSKRMSKFGIYNTLENLSGGDALKYEAYMNMTYSEVFTILLMRKTASDIQREMNEIKIPTNKE